MARLLGYLALVSATVVTATQYSLVDNYQGVQFLQMFDYFNDADPTKGHVKYLDRPSALVDSLVGVIPDQNDSVYVGIDYKTPSPLGRKSIRLTSHKTYNQGSLFIADFAHMPGGICGVWPAYWLLGKEAWPKGGEIDILEGVNDAKTNAMTLHTSPGCRVNSVKGTNSASSDLVTADCDVNAPNQDKNAGCAFKSRDELSYGAGFNANGGGIYATEWNSTMISIWFFPRSAIPADIIAAETPNPAQWGLPTAQFGGACDITYHFKDMNIIIDTTFCGEWAGNVWDQSPECKAKAPTCEDYITKASSEIADAYWSINYIRVYQGKE